jgi:hypothetical protein
VSDAVEAGRQDMEQKPSDELVGGDSHDPAGGRRHCVGSPCSGR